MVAEAPKLRLPFGGREEVLEIGFSDDRRPVSSTASGLARLLHTLCQGCWAAGGSVNSSKLKAFRVALRGGRLMYEGGSIATVVGPLAFETSGLHLVGVPLLMGEAPNGVTNAALLRCRKVLAGICRLRPRFVLALRIVQGFVVSRLDYTFEAVPPVSTHLAAVQKAVDGCLTAALRVPRSTPKVLLHAPLQCGGFGGPDLMERLSLRYVLGVAKAMNSRNAWVKRTTRWALSHPEAIQVSASDLAVFRNLSGQWGLMASVVPSPNIAPSQPTVRVLRAYGGGDVVLMSDNSAPDHCLGWGALVADHLGVLATLHDGVAVDVSFSWAAEWAGKLAALELATSLSVPHHSIRWSIADNLSAVLGPDGGRPSASLWIDLIRLKFASYASAGWLQEGYMPAQHNSGWTHLVAKWQAQCDALAGAGAAAARDWSYPFPSVLEGCALLFRHGRLVVNHHHTHDAIHLSHIPPLLQAAVDIHHDVCCLAGWCKAVEGGGITDGVV